MNNENPLMQLPGESARWYSLFLSFIEQGRKRSVLSVYHQERGTAKKGAKNSTIPSSWQKVIKRFQWRERAEAFDSVKLTQKVKAFEKMRGEEIRARFHVFRQLRKKLALELKTFMSKPMEWRDLLRGLEILRSVDFDGAAKPEGARDPEEFIRECQKAAEKMMTFDPLGIPAEEKH